MSYAKFVTHQGKQMLCIDLSNLRYEQAVLAVEETKTIVGAQPPKSLRIITDIRESEFSPRIVKLMKEFTRFNTPFVLASAVVANGLRKALTYTVSTFAKREIHVFDTLEQAKDWLAKT